MATKNVKLEAETIHDHMENLVNISCGEYSYENCLDCPHWRIQLDDENHEEMFFCDKV